MGLPLHSLCLHLLWLYEDKVKKNDPTLHEERNIEPVPPQLEIKTDFEHKRIQRALSGDRND